MGITLKSMAIMLVLVFLTAPYLIVSLPVKAGFRTLVVPDDYPTISSAIGNATAGDTIFVKKGTYEEKTLEINKTLSLIGEDVNSTVVKIYASILNVTQILTQFWISLSNSIIINANDVRLSKLTIVTGGNIVATGDRIQIIGNNITMRNSDQGLSISGSYCNITDNTSDGLINLSGFHNTIARNSVYRITINKDFNLISNNTVSGNGVKLSNANSNVVYGNNMLTTTGDYGLYIVENSSHNIIHNNNVSALFRDVEINSDSAENNTFYHNNFLMQYGNDAASLYTYNSTLVNFWDNGEEGNYWEDYNGTDADRDGIGDTPYVIDGNNVDNYPLMFPYDIEDDTVVLPPPEPFPTALVTTVSVALVAVIGVGLLVYFKKRDQ